MRFIRAKAGRGRRSVLIGGAEDRSRWTQRKAAQGERRDFINGLWSKLSRCALTRMRRWHNPYLSLLLGVDTLAYTDNFDFTSHLDLAWRTFEALHVMRPAIVPTGQALRLLSDREIPPSLESEAAA